MEAKGGYAMKNIKNVYDKIREGSSMNKCWMNVDWKQKWVTWM